MTYVSCFYHAFSGAQKVSLAWGGGCLLTPHLLRLLHGFGTRGGGLGSARGVRHQNRGPCGEEGEPSPSAAPSRSQRRLGAVGGGVNQPPREAEGLGKGQPAPSLIQGPI